MLKRYLNFSEIPRSLSALFGEFAILRLATSWNVTGEYILLSSTGDVTLVVVTNWEFLNNGPCEIIIMLSIIKEKK